MKQRFTFLYLLLFFPFFLSAQNNSVDSLKVLYKDSEDRIQRIDLSLQIAFLSKSPDEALKYARLAFQLGDKENDILAKAKASYYWGRSLRQKGENETAISRLQEAVQLADLSKDENWIINTNIELCRALNNSGLYQQSVPILKEVIHLSDESGF